MSCTRSFAFASLLLMLAATPARAQESGFADPGQSFATPPTVAANDQLTVNRSQRDLVLPRGWIRVDLGLTVGDVRPGGNNAFFWHDLGAGIGLFRGFETGVSVNRDGFWPRFGAGLLPIGYDGDNVEYGEIAFYGRYQFLSTDHVRIAADLEFDFPTRSRFGFRAWVPVRIVTDNISFDTGMVFEVLTDPGQPNLFIPGILTLNVMERLHFRGGIGMGWLDFDGDGFFMPFFFGAGYAMDLDGGTLDIGGEFGFPFLVNNFGGDAVDPEFWFMKVTLAVNVDVF